MREFKHILVLTDFSSSSLEGISIAKALAISMGSKISILHAYRLLPGLAKVENSSGKFLKEKIEKNLKEKTNLIDSKYFERKKEPRHEFLIELGFLGDVLETYLNKYDPELIIMGTKRIQKHLRGSMVNLVIKQFNKPLLIVPQKNK